ncbi:hypothetical protein RISK_002599 [Rhodopirellula islandica]|uniref:Uncharacterized protein n=1 Tax=Rhodopirellula islandica TaxID=595434 RepID=A0A0J1BFR8_RHOIS|nr:hypothetical protein RISK_002599 [Rhodopirellula islandica]
MKDEGVNLQRCFRATSFQIACSLSSTGSRPWQQHVVPWGLIRIVVPSTNPTATKW